MKTRRILVLGIASVLLTPFAARAVTDTWDGGSLVDSNLNTGANWVDNTAPLSDLVNTDLIFAGVVRLTPNVSAPFSTRSVTFNNTAGAFNIGGSTLFVGAGGIVNNDTGIQTFTNLLTVPAAAVSFNAASGGLSFTNTLNLTANVLSLDGGGAFSFAAFSGTGPVTKNGLGTMTWSPGSIQSLDFSINAGIVNLVADGTTDIFDSNANLAVNAGTLNIAESLTLDGAQLTRASGAAVNIGTGKTLTIQNGGDAIFTGSFLNITASTIAVTGAGSTLSAISNLGLGGGSTTNISAGGSVSSGSIGVGFFGNGTVTVDGGGSSFGGGTLSIGSGDTSSVTFSNGSTGSFSSLSVDNAVAAGTSGTLNIQSGAAVTGTSLSLANLVGATTGTVTVSGTNSMLTLSGNATIGAASLSTGALNVQSGGTFTSSAGTTTVNPTGTIAIVGGTFNVNGNANLTVNGGLMTRNSAGALNLALNTTLTVQGGGDVAITGLWLQGTQSNLTIDGNGSAFTTGGDFQWEGGNSTLSLLNIRNGGALSVGGSLHLARNDTAVSVNVTGAGSQINASPFFTSEWLASVSLRSGASASLGALRLADVSSGTNINGSFQLLSGSAATLGSIAAATQSFPANATITVDGAGSQITQTGAATLTLGAAFSSSATLEIGNGGTFTSGTGTLTLNATGTINVNGGTLNLNGPIADNGGAVNFTSGALNTVSPLTIGIGGLLGDGDISLPANRRFSTTAATTIDALRTLTLDGGTLRTSALTNNGIIAFNSGTLAVTGAGGFNIGTGALGSNVTLGTGANLQVTSTASVAGGATLTLNGGTFTAGTLNNTGTIRANLGIASAGNGTNSSGGRIFISDLLDVAGVFTSVSGARITLEDGTGLLSGAGALNNAGLLTGDGTILKPLTNGTTGEVRAESGKTLYFSGAATNSGQFNLLGGSLDFSAAVTNNATGFISGRGAIFTGGLTNNGQLAFSGGNTDLRGDVTLNAGSRVVTSGAGSVTSFFDDLVHNGLEIFTGASASTVFFGAQSGAGPFTGTGTVYFNGDLRPGNSPAEVSYGGDLVFGAAASLTLEIGGLAAGSEHDHLEIAGTLHADGLLALALFDGFVPDVGDAFDVLDAGAFAGDFDAIRAPALPEGSAWDFSALKSTGTVTVVPEPGTALLALVGAAAAFHRRRRNPVTSL